MRKILALTLILGMAVLVGGYASATGGNELDPADATISGVKYDWWGSEGELSIVGAPGSHYAVFDSMGHAIAGGMLETQHVSFIAGNSGTGPDGVVVFVLVDDEVVAVTDPDWNWD